jgi:hypothetical protein
MKIVLTTKCPNCGSTEKKRLMGMGFWETLPGSRKYECEDCNTDYLRFYGFINFILLYGKFVKQKKKNKLLIIVSKLVKYSIVIAFAFFIFHNADRIKRRVVKIIRGPKNTEMQYFIERTKEKTLTTTTDPKIKGQISELYKKAEQQILQKKLMSPKGDNAWETYNEILKIDPNWNSHAIEGLRLVKEEEINFRKEEDIKKQNANQQILNQINNENFETIKEKVEQRNEQSKLQVEKQVEERKQEIEREKQILKEQEKEIYKNQLIEDFWLTLDLTWERIFAKYIGKERILKSDVETIFLLEEINCDKQSLRNLEPLFYLPNLKKLSVSHTGIHSLQPLKNLAKLEYLNCSHNNIPSLESLNKMENLIDLDCSNNQIELLEPIKNNVKMKTLNVSNTKISTLNRISNFRELTELDISFTNISLLSGLNSNKLQSLAMARTGITDISSLAQQKGLTYLDCSHTKIEEISSLQNLIQLTYLDLSYTLISTIRPLRNLIQMEVLKISGTTLENIIFIENMTQLKELHCNSYYLTGLEPFEKLVNLEYVLVNRNTHTQTFEKIHPKTKVEKKF